MFCSYHNRFAVHYNLHNHYSDANPLSFLSVVIFNFDLVFLYILHFRIFHIFVYFDSIIPVILNEKG